MKTTNNFAFERWASAAGDRQVTGYRISDLKEPMLYDHWSVRLAVAILRVEGWYQGLVAEFWGLFWTYA